jgi:hypothetical protein
VSGTYQSLDIEGWSGTPFVTVTGDSGTVSIPVTQTTQFVMQAYGSSGSVIAESNPITITVAPTDYGAAFVGTWAGVWGVTTPGGTENPLPALGTATAVFTESGINNMLMNMVFTDSQATSVSCSGSFPITAGPQQGGGFAPGFGTLAFGGGHTCTAFGAVGCSGGDLVVDFNGGSGAVYTSWIINGTTVFGNVLVLYWPATQACSNGGPAQTVAYVIPLLKQ